MVASAHEEAQSLKMKMKRKGMPKGGSSDCAKKCNYRCSKSSRYKLCYRDCNACCRACGGCVPPGTAGNRQYCPCYARIKNSKGTGKCP
ncbi:hypothetical protein KP509_04G072800 [Ceratopteris richardii]|nr:hypothetical protein KP509_04G072800 [Ceratopteris richardii]